MPLLSRIVLVLILILSSKLPNGHKGVEQAEPGIMMKAKYRRAPSDRVHITETSYEGRPHFLIRTPSATYYFDKAGGGFSRLIDPAGHDWIGFKMKPWGAYPSAAASAFRGIPNTVYQSDDDGAGHPGHDQCESRQIAENTILSTSKSGRWQWEWHFLADHARLEIRRVAPDHPYWFLYEGPVGGRFAPGSSYFGTDLGGPDTGQYDFYRGGSIYGQWQWAYFGQKDQDRVLYLHQETPDTLLDTFGYLGNTEQGIEAPDGMVVFGFGRADGAQPLLRQPLLRQPHVFRLGFWEAPVLNAKAHKRLARFLHRWD